MLTPLLQRSLESPLTGVEPSRPLSDYCLTNKRARGGIAQLSEIIRELTQLSEGVHPGTAGLRESILARIARSMK